MPQVLENVCDCIAKHRQKDSFWVTFNTVYNDINAFKNRDKYAQEDLFVEYLNDKNTDKEMQKEFLDFMQENFPDVKLIPVFDHVGPEWMIYPYLGSYLIDADIDSDVFKKICARFENPDGSPKDNRLVIWTMTYEEAKKCSEKLQEVWETELS